MLQGQQFGMSQSSANEWIHQLLPLLTAALDTLGVMPERDGAQTAQLERRQWKWSTLIGGGVERRRRRPKNGCMRVIPGTQTVSLQEMRTRTDVSNGASSRRIDSSFVDKSRAVDLVLQPGDVSVHQPNIIHGSNANNSPMRRAGLTIRYIPTSTLIAGGSEWPCRLPAARRGCAGYESISAPAQIRARKTYALPHPPF